MRQLRLLFTRQAPCAFCANALTPSAERELRNGVRVGRCSTQLPSLLSPSFSHTCATKGWVASGGEGGVEEAWKKSARSCRSALLLAACAEVSPPPSPPRPPDMSPCAPSSGLAIMGSWTFPPKSTPTSDHSCCGVLGASLGLFPPNARLAPCMCSLSVCCDAVTRPSNQFCVVCAALMHVTCIASSRGRLCSSV